MAKAPLHIGSKPDTADLVFNRGGNWNNGSNGLASFNGNNARSNSNTNIGFRSALPHKPDIADSRVCFQSTRIIKGAYSLGLIGQKIHAA